MTNKNFDTELSFQSNDSLITTNLTKRLARDLNLQGLTIEIETKEGIVHLYGLVNNINEAQHAEKIAKQITGVVEVRNYLRIKLGR